MRGEAKVVHFIGVVLVAKSRGNSFHCLQDFRDDGIYVDAAGIVYGNLIAIPKLFIRFPPASSVNGCRVGDLCDPVCGVYDGGDGSRPGVVLLAGIKCLYGNCSRSGIAYLRFRKADILEAGNRSSEEALVDGRPRATGNAQVPGGLLRGKKPEADGLAQIVKAGSDCGINKPAVVHILGQLE